MHDNEFETKGNKSQTKNNTEPPHTTLYKLQIIKELEVSDNL